MPSLNLEYLQFAWKERQKTAPERSQWQLLEADERERIENGIEQIRIRENRIGEKKSKSKEWAHRANGGNYGNSSRKKK